jgi:hypothetical protein
MNADLGALFAFISLRALGEHDPVEYARATDASRRELDDEIDRLLQDLRKTEADSSEVRDAAFSIAWLREIERFGESRTELLYALRQLHMASLQRAQQIAIVLSERGRNEPSGARRSPAGLSDRPAASISPPNERLRLGVARLLRELREYTPTYEYASIPGILECVLEPDPFSAERPTIIIKGGGMETEGDARRAMATLRSYLRFWDKGTLGVILSEKIGKPLGAILDGATVFVLEYDVESDHLSGDRLNELIGAAGGSRAT